METAPLAAAHADVSMWALFMQASLVVKLVMIGLIGAVHNMEMIARHLGSSQDD